MTRILIATTVPSTLRAFFLPFAHAFKAQGWDVDAIARDVSSCTQCAATFDNLWDVDWKRAPYYFGNLVRAPRRIQQIVEQREYDCILVSTPVASFVIRYALRGLRGRSKLTLIYIAQGFHFYRDNNGLTNRICASLEILAGGWTDYLIVVNREDADAVRRLNIVHSDRLVHMPGIGVDTDKFSPEAVADHEVEQFRNSINLGLDNPLFSLIGEFIPRKRHRDALMAFSKLNAPAAHLAFVGKGPLLENMRRLAARLGIGERVHFLGFRHDVPIIMRASVCVLSVSSQEGLPVNVVEALSLGVPVIGSDIRGTHDLLEDGCGILYPLGDRNQLTEAMAYVLRYPAAARELSAQGLVKMRSGYSREEIVNNYVELIKAITVRDVCQC